MWEEEVAWEWRVGGLFFDLQMPFIGTADYVQDVVPRLNSYYSDSPRSKSAKKSIDDDLRQIGFINGICNTERDCLDSCILIEQQAHTDVDYIWDPTKNFMDDINLAAILKYCDENGILLGDEVKVIKALHEQWDRQLQATDNQGLILQICHSRGALWVKKALETYDPELRKHIRVAAFGPAVIIPNDLCEKAINYISRGDLTYLFADGRRSDDCNVVYLDRAPGAPWFDHPFGSPTYQDALEQTMKAYNKVCVK